MKYSSLKKGLTAVLLTVLMSYVATAQFDDLYVSDSDVDITYTSFDSSDDDVYDYTDSDDYSSYADSDDYVESRTSDRYNDNFDNVSYTQRINRFNNRGSFGYNSVVFVPTNRWNRWGNPGWNSWGNPWNDPFVNGWNNPGWGGTNVFINVGARPWGWNRYNRWNRWDNGWGNSWNNGWGNSWNNGWGNSWNNGWAGGAGVGNSWNACPTGVAWSGNRATAIIPTRNNNTTFNGSRRGTNNVGTRGRTTIPSVNDGRLETRNTSSRTGSRGTEGVRRTRTDRGSSTGGTTRSSATPSDNSRAPIYSRDRSSSRSSARSNSSGSTRSSARSSSSRSSNRSSFNNSRSSSRSTARPSTRSSSRSSFNSGRSSRSSSTIRSSGRSSRSSSGSSRSSSRRPR